MTKYAAVLCSLLFSAPALATEPYTIIVTAAQDRGVTAARVEKAAQKVCLASIAADALGDFGSMDECIANTLHAVRHVTLADAPLMAQVNADR